MRKTNKKGFTIVELVIVIAVIAVLAAVLIPTFVSLVNKADAASDTAVAKNMNTALAEYSTLNGAPETFDEVLDAIEEYGYVLANLNAKADGNLYGWDKANNQIVYIDAEGKTIYKNKDFKPTDLQIVISDSNVKVPEGYAQETVVDMSKIAGANLGAFKEALLDGKDVTLRANLTLDIQLAIPADAKVTLDLNGNTLKTVKTGERSKYLDVQGELTIKNGTFEARGIEVLTGGKLIVEANSNVTVSNVDNQGGAAVWVEPGAEVVINGGTFTALNGKKNNTSATLTQNPSVIYNNGGKVTINGGTFKSVNSTAYAINGTSGETIINGGTFESAHGVVCTVSGKVTINGGKFTLKPYTDGTYDGHVVYNPTSNENSIIINGGEFIDERETGKSIFYGKVEDLREAD